MLIFLSFFFQQKILNENYGPETEVVKGNSKGKEVKGDEHEIGGEEGEEGEGGEGEDIFHLVIPKELEVGEDDDDSQTIFFRIYIYIFKYRYYCI